MKDHRATEKTVKLSQLRRKENRLYAEGSPVTFVGYLQPDISIIFPIPTFEVMNPHVLKQMRDSLASRQYESAFRQWRTCEIRLQELGAQYESELLEQLQTWLT